MSRHQRSCQHVLLCLLSLLHLPPLLSSIHLSFYSWNFFSPFFCFSALWGTDVPFSFGLSLKTCFCKCPLPQLYSRKEEIKNTFLSIPDVTYMPVGKCAYPHLNKWKKCFIGMAGVRWHGALAGEGEATCSRIPETWDFKAQKDRFLF